MLRILASTLLYAKNDDTSEVFGATVESWFYTRRSNLVGEWEEWTECDNPCGYGTRRRIRTVNVHPDNGGNNCPVLKQRRACVGYKKQVCFKNLLGEQEEEKADGAGDRSSSLHRLPNLSRDVNELHSSICETGKTQVPGENGILKGFLTKTCAYLKAESANVV
ncbi:somatomedin-b and thrombospondin type-1 domain-containing protein [Plakobranchus ocellatus]|uniref:Somatomedin-b and thrombospondin type-1 domain-containing protein n=1 Tax=Plakobranchus ocellatus TaxID=259542 RepID=A0AAV3ZUQ6_9GAST|nr:somatomedin-b and thrombospondin type-1 domain-containing protein [Plakobranchus ocellatus]